MSWWPFNKRRDGDRRDAGRADGSLRSPRRAARSEETSDGRTRTLRSPALAALFGALEPADPDAPAQGSQVLDLGPALGRNIEILGQRTAGLRIADLYRTLARRRSESLDDALEEVLADLDPSPQAPDSEAPLHLRRGYHAVLAWDVPSYLERGDLERLVECLARWTRPGGVVHAIVYHGKQMPAEPRRFLIAAPGEGTGPYRGTMGELLYDVSGSTRPAPDLNPALMERLFEPFRLERSYLLQDGAREYLFVREHETVGRPPEGSEDLDLEDRPVRSTDEKSQRR